MADPSQQQTADPDMKDVRQQFDDDMEDWREARTERGIDMKYLAGDPWEKEAKDLRDENGRPYLTLDELSQYVNQLSNEVRANPRAVQFAPTGPGTSEKVSQFYADKMREIEYRSHAQLAYTTAFESAVMGSYGFVRVANEFAADSVDRQELVIKPVMDPNTIVPDPRAQRPDLSDMRRCFVLEWMPQAQFKHDYPKAKIQNFESYQTDTDYAKWVKDDRVLLAERWRVVQTPTKLLKIQLQAVEPPPSAFGFRPAAQQPPQDIHAKDWAQWQARGAKVLGERETTIPTVTQQLVNGVEILKETTWPGPYIPIAGCLGRILYLDEGGTSKRVILSAVRLTRDPYMAYCFYRTCEMENVGTTTKNPYWAYQDQVDPVQQQEIAKSMHAPVAVLFAKALTEATRSQVLPLPIKNSGEPAIQAVSLAAEEMRRAIQSAMASNFLPTSAGRQNEKSGIALNEIEKARQKGSFHFVDHYEMMLRHVGVICEAAMPEIYDTARRVLVRRGDDKTEQVWINNPQEKESLDLKGNYAVTVSSGPSMDSTREAASDFADNLLGSEALMQLLGPEKAQQIVALAVKLKVKQTGIGAIGDQIVDIISPPSQDEDLTPEQLKQKVAQMGQQLQQAQQMLQQAAMEKESGLAKEKEKTQRDVQLEQMNQNFQMVLQQLKGMQAMQLQAAKDAGALAKQDDAQAHDLGISAADAKEAEKQAHLSTLTTLAGNAHEGNGANV